MKHKKILFIFFIFAFGLSSGFIFDNLIQNDIPSVVAEDFQFDEQEATIRAIKNVMPAVVSIVAYGDEETMNIDLITGEKTITKERIVKGSGTGFIFSQEGLIMTNRHVVNVVDEKEGEFKAITNNGEEYIAKLVGKDPLKDLAILQIFDENLPYVEFGDSDILEIGSTVIAIGNVLGRYQNTVTKGIVSGLGRSIYASDKTGNDAELLDSVIQTDAEINRGNSGGPLVNLKGEVVGINVAIDEEGTAIGFSIPVNDARPIVNSIRRVGRIIRPRLGVRYIMITPEIAKDNNLNFKKGAYLIKGNDGSSAILPDSPAEKAGLQTGDIIYEINAIKLEGNNTLFSVVQRYKPGDKIGLKVRRGEKDMIIVVILDEFK